MTEPAKNRQASCEGKAQLPTAKLARDRARRLNNRQTVACQPYRCKHCGFYHLGSNNKMPSKRQRLREELSQVRENE